MIRHLCYLLGTHPNLYIFGLLCLKYLINSFFIFQYLVKVTKNEKISCPVYLLFTEKVNFLLVNKEKKISVKTGSKRTGQLTFLFFLTLTK